MTIIPPQVIRASQARNAANPVRKKWLIAGLMLAIFAAAASWFYPGVKAQAQAGVAYGARVGCSCLFVQGRDVDSCETDFEPGMAAVSLSVDSVAKTATASVPLLASRTARFAPPSGC
jgi:hypothetical protein